jgi:hypothetical protein
MIRTLRGNLIYRFNLCMNKWTLNYGQDWEQIIKLHRIMSEQNPIQNIYFIQNANLNKFIPMCTN